MCGSYYKKCVVLVLNVDTSIPCVFCLCVNLVLFFYFFFSEGIMEVEGLRSADAKI